MSDYETAAGTDRTSRPTSEEHGASDSVLHGATYRHADGERSAPANDNRAHVSRPAQNRKIKQIGPEDVLRAFNTWAFKREQPSDPQLILQFVARAMAEHKPVPFLFYWGKGPRCATDEHDLKCLDYIGAFAERTAEVYEPGAAIKLIFTDTHARLNGYPECGISNYIASVDAEAHRRGFGSCRLSDLIEKTNAKAEDYSLGDVIPADMMNKLSASAMKWYHGAGTAEQGAVIYFHMNMIEKRAVELAFPDAIFATFNSRKFRILFPKRLPIFHMYSMQRGVSVKPWFLPAEAAPCDDLRCACRSGKPETGPGTFELIS